MTSSVTQNRQLEKKKKGGKSKPVYVFVDNENVNISVQKQGWKIDWGKLIAWMKEQWNVEKVYMFMGYHPDFEEMYSFFETLGYTLIFRRMMTESDGPMKGNIDTELVLQAMIDFQNYSKAVIVSGDGDFTCLIEYLRFKKKLGVLLVPNKNRYSHFLGQMAGEENIITLSDLKKKLRYHTGSSQKKSKKSAQKQGLEKSQNTNSKVSLKSDAIASEKTIEKNSQKSDTKSTEKNTHKKNESLKAKNVDDNALNNSNKNVEEQPVKKSKNKRYSNNPTKKNNTKIM